MFAYITWRLRKNHEAWLKSSAFVVTSNTFRIVFQWLIWIAKIGLGCSTYAVLICRARCVRPALSHKKSLCGKQKKDMNNARNALYSTAPYPYIFQKNTFFFSVNNWNDVLRRHRYSSLYLSQCTLRMTNNDSITHHLADERKRMQ